jgi:PAS domain S-box-containing protein
MTVSSSTELSTSAVPEFLSGGGELGQRIREYEWASTSLGPVETWPHSLRTCIRIMLTSRQPIWIGWGKELIKLYNDPYKAIVGGKHPWALGKPASVVWKDIWRDIEPMLKQVMEKDEGTYVESQLLIMERNGYPEETYYTFSYTPIPGDDGKTAGMFCANTDDTDRITSERQLKTLTHLGKRLADCKSNREIIQQTIATLEENPQDFPFAIFRSIQDNKAVLTHSTPLGPSSPLVAKDYDINADNEVGEIIRKTLATRKPQVFDGLLKKVGDLPRGAWELSPDKLIVLPIMTAAGTSGPYGILSVGLNPFKLLDEKYLGFFTLVADQIATSFSDVHMLEEERKRSEALAEIDRAKTTFFSNISHEFRTPLTLLLGPIQDALNDPSSTEENKVRMEVAQRNALRMQKLVNNLLDFSRIEAGRMQGKFTSVNICSFTQDLVSTFRSAIEKAEMNLDYECEGVHNKVYVDVDMWEKIVLNLVSNAFKYTTEGSITVRVTEEEKNIVLSVSDTGIGIPADQIEKVFDRFHRVENTQGRSQEGTGIGLAMVKELVRMHQGSIAVDSEVGKGSTFTVRIPTGDEHLEKGTISEAPTSLSHYAEAFAQEAMKWNRSDDTDLEIVDDAFESAEVKGAKRYKVLLADDNADMRDYVKRLLSEEFKVITAIDGEDAFKKVIQEKPDLLLSDIMMPKVDGFELLKRIRQHADQKNLPVILLSARAGEEAKVEGLDAGADDYLVKPFSAKELMARVEANIKISKSRAAAEANLREMIKQSPVATTLLKGRDLVIEIANERALEVWGRKHEEVINRAIVEALPEITEQGFDRLLQQVYSSGVPFNGSEVPVQLMRFGKPEIVYLNFIYQPLKNENGQTEGIIGAGIDVTEQVLSRKKIEQSQKELNQLANAVPQLVWVANANGDVIYYNERLAEFSGAKKETDGKWLWKILIHPDDLPPTEKAWDEASNSGIEYQMEHRMKMKTGEYRWFLSRAIPHKDENGRVVKWFGTATDIHSSKEHASILEKEVLKRTQELNELNASLKQSNNELQQFAHVASHDLKEPLRKIKTFAGRLVDDKQSSFSENGKLYLKKVNSAVDRMSVMIDGVLNYSMISAAHQRIEKVDLNETIRDIESDLELIITQKQATIECGELPTVEGASVLLYQLFYNLLNNSLKFSNAEQPPVIKITSDISRIGGKEYAEINISDNGIGFEQEFAERIFETFLRLNSKDMFEGTGLGLSLCKRIAERHGGFIKAVGELNKGATFVTYLPLQQENKNI